MQELITLFVLSGNYYSLKHLLILFLTLNLSTTVVPAQHRAPDYSQQADWLASPFKDDPSDYAPGGKGRIVSDSAVDIFFLFPTSFQAELTDGTWNASLDDPKVNNESLSRSIKYQASIFNKAGRVFAPNYRQANYNVFLQKGRQSKQALDQAYADILTAWHYYLEHYNQGRPFIIAGHSQGALHAARLLKDEIDGKPLSDRLIIAYIPGMPIKKGDFTSLQPCSDSTGTGCITSWRTYLDGYKPEWLQSESRGEMILSLIHI